MTEPKPNPTTHRDPFSIILVDHGSRRDESNAMLLDVVRDFAAATGYAIVEPAHMELAEPSIATAFARCVERGATTVVVFPYFLLPGRHWSEDIPRLSAAAAANHPGVRYLVTAPFALHPLMAQSSNSESSTAWPTLEVMSMLAKCVLAPTAASCAGSSDYVARAARTIGTKADPASRRTQLPVISSHRSRVSPKRALF